jgi:acyl-[acyl-carrier-protein]-phospholipid O-acyltransferase / long-chain-fatty-acid--[acyl-carrier-protein] ligase
MSDIVAGRSDDGRGGAYSLSFLALVATQFFVSLNDNMFRWLVISIGADLLGNHWNEMPAIVRESMKAEDAALSLALSLGLACFTLPFLVFAAPAGFLADRFSKRRVMVACKVAEVAVIGFGVVAILLGSVPLMFVILFILGGQAMMFITSKLGAIPEIVRSDNLSSANGLINMVSMAGIILGALAGNWLHDQTVPVGQSNSWLLASALLGVAACGLATSLFIKPLRAANPSRAIPWNPLAQTARDFRVLHSDRSLFLAGLGSAYFWMLGSLSQLNIDQFATKHLGITAQAPVGGLLAAMMLGIGGGALLAGICSRGKVELGLVPFGGLGIALAAMLLLVVPAGASGHFPLGPYGVTAMLLLAMGASAGLYDIPLQAFMQYRSPATSRGSIMAAYNFLAFTGMLLASGIYLLLSGLLGLRPPMIFLVSGLTTVLVTVFIVWRLPFETTRLFVRIVTGLMYRVRVEGIENVPPGGALVVANHVSWADGVLLGLACPRHPRMVAFAEYFQNRWLAWFGRLGRIIPIGKSRKSMVDSIRAAREALQHGELVCIFPEGGITRTGKTEEFRPGFLSILKDTGAPVVPVYLGGLWGSVFSYEGGKFFWKWPRRWRYPVTIRFGKPIQAPASVDQVRQAVEELKNGDE